MEKDIIIKQTTPPPPIILSKYLQKYIIDIIITNVNKEKKHLSYGKFTYKLENEFKDLEKVCWYWFESISNKSNIISYDQLSSTNNSNSTSNSKYSIIKKENIKYLYIKSSFLNLKDNENNDDSDDDDEENNNKEESVINSIILKIKNSISNYPNLKRIIINLQSYYLYKIINGLNNVNENDDNNSNTSSPVIETTQIEALKQIKVSAPYLGYKNNIINSPNNIVIIDKVNSLNINHETTMNDYELKKLHSYLKNIKHAQYIYIYGKSYQLLLKQIYNQNNQNNQNNNINNNNISSTSTTTNPTTTSSIIKCLSNIEGYDFYESPVTIEQLYYLLKLSSPSKLKDLVIEICYDNLIYQLETNYNSNSNNKSNSDSDDESLITTPPPSPCRYCSENYGTFLESSSQFKNQWEFIYNTIKNSNTLKIFKMTHRCPSNSNFHETTFGNSTGEYQNLETIPKYTIENLGSMFKNNKSIRMLTIDSLQSPQLLEYIFSDDYENNDYSNKSIFEIFSSFRILNQPDSVRLNFIKIAKDIILKNNQIRLLFLSELDENNDLIEEFYQYDKNANIYNS